MERESRFNTNTESRINPQRFLKCIRIYMLCFLVGCIPVERKKTTHQPQISAPPQVDVVNSLDLDTWFMSAEPDGTIVKE